MPPIRARLRRLGFLHNGEATDAQRVPEDVLSAPPPAAP